MPMSVRTVTSLSSVSAIVAFGIAAMSCGDAEQKRHGSEAVDPMSPFPESLSDTSTHWINGLKEHVTIVKSPTSTICVRANGVKLRWGSQPFLPAIVVL